MTVEERLEKLERELEDLNRAFTGLRHYVGVAANYVPKLTTVDRVNDVDPLGRTVLAIQEALKKAAEYEPRRKRNRR